MFPSITLRSLCLFALCAAGGAAACAPEEPAGPPAAPTDSPADVGRQPPGRSPPDTARILLRVPAASKLALKRAVSGPAVAGEVP